TDEWLTRRSLPPDVRAVSTGHITRDQSIERVPWKGITITPDILGLRALNLLVALVPLGLAVLIFDRFDPARGRRRARKAGFFARLASKWKSRRSAATAESEPAPRPSVALSPVAVSPSVRSSILAEARLVWESASFVKWPLAVAA